MTPSLWGHVSGWCWLTFSECVIVIVIFGMEACAANNDDETNTMKRVEDLDESYRVNMALGWAMFWTVVDIVTFRSTTDMETETETEAIS